MKDFAISFTFFNQLDALEKAIESAMLTSSLPHEYIFLDNGSTEDFIGRLGYRFHDAKIIRNKENKGIIEPYNQIYQACKSDWIGYFHSDIIIHEPGWDERIINKVNELEKLGIPIGIVGFMGSRGADEIGARIGFASNLRGVAELHGKRMEDWMPAVMLDGAALIIRKELLSKLGGFDSALKVHHLYDYMISMDSISAGFNNIVVGIDFTHTGGITACRGDAQTYFKKAVNDDFELLKHYEKLKEKNKDITPEQVIMDYNIQMFRNKYVNKGYLPLYITQDWIASRDISHVKA